jgi:hypothetical protein
VTTDTEIVVEGWSHCQNHSIKQEGNDTQPSLFSCSLIFCQQSIPLTGSDQKPEVKRDWLM